MIFTNDNGGLTEEVNRPWRGTKNTTYEGGIRVPFIARWPGHLQADTTNDAMMHVTDLFPTFVTLAGGSLDQPRPLDGIDMSGVMLEGKPSPREEIVIEVAGSVRLPTLRLGDFKLVGDQLYHLATDLRETSDIASEHPQLVAEMSARLESAAARAAATGRVAPSDGPRTALRLRSTRERRRAGGNSVAR